MDQSRPSLGLAFILKECTRAQLLSTLPPYVIGVEFPKIRQP